MRPTASAAVVFACLVVAGTPARAQDIALTTNASGITIGGSAGSWSTGFGAVNGLGLGTPVTGATILSPSGGKLYTSPYDIVITGASGSVKAIVKAYVSANFAHPSILQAYACSSSCTNAANYSAVSTSSGSPSNIIASPGLHSTTVTRYLGVFVSNQNGASAFSGTDSATLTLLVYDGSTLRQTYTLALNNPSENMQTALTFGLATASGGRTISAGSDFSLSYGTVNALGLSPGTGLTVSSVSGGVLYSTPYLLQPTFAGFSSTSGTLTTYVSTDFVNPSDLELRDSTTSTGSSFSAISKVSGSQSTLTSSATTGASLTRYLGLFVSNTGTSPAGADSATLTFTLVVP